MATFDVIVVMQTARRMTSYLDDFLWSDSALAVDALVEFVRWLFDALGFEVSAKKSVWTPCQTIQFLGLLFDSAEYRFEVPAEKIDRALRLIAACLTRVHLTVAVRDIARVCGHILSMRLAVSPARVFTRALYAMLSDAPAWNARVPLTPAAIDELRFWENHLRAFNGRPAVRLASEVTVLCDASSDGWGAHMSNRLDVSAFGLFPPHQCEPFTSSTFRELLGLLCALKSPEIIGAIRGRRATLLLDSQAAVFNLRKGGGPVAELSELVKAIWLQCLSIGVDAEADWIARDRNAAADALSRYLDHGDWALSADAFALIVSRYGPFDVDRFAAAHNAKCVRFNSRHFDPAAEAADAFTQDWSRSRNYCNPPFDLIGRVVATIREQKAWAVVVFPVWPKQPWFGELRLLCSDCITLPPSRTSFLPGPRSAIHRPSVANWPVCAALLDCSTARPAQPPSNLPVEPMRS